MNAPSSGAAKTLAVAITAPAIAMTIPPTSAAVPRGPLGFIESPPSLSPAPPRALAATIGTRPIAMANPPSIMSTIMARLSASAWAAVYESLKKDRSGATCTAATPTTVDAPTATVARGARRCRLTNGTTVAASMVRAGPATP